MATVLGQRQALEPIRFRREATAGSPESIFREGKRNHCQLGKGRFRWLDMEEEEDSPTGCCELEEKPNQKLKKK